MNNLGQSLNVPAYLFVYGTLMGGQREDVLGEVGAKFVGRGTIRAKLYDLGQYPGAKSDQRHQVRGELYRLTDPEKAITLLDEYEEFVVDERRKSLFVRDRALVTLEDGRTRTAWVYLYNRPVDESQFMPSGDYRDRARERIELR
jgi:gamma-glutamylcyclotransferase (GGCT)/AIG2-like uncharacterized protein YtfP